MLLAQRSERWDVARIRDSRDDDAPVAVVERRRERIGVDSERDGAGCAKRACDVDALADRGEEHDHDARAYSEESAATRLRSAPCPSRSASCASSRD